MRVTYDEAREKATYGSGVIDESGFYKGKIKQCWLETKDSGAKFINFEIETDNGVVNFDFCIIGTKGDKTFAFGHLDSLIVILGLDELGAINGTVEVYSWEAKAKIKKPAETFTCLVNHEVGFYIQKEYYINNKGEIKYKFQLRHFFRASDAKTSREIKENKPAAFYKTMSKRYAKEMINVGNYEYKPYDEYLKQQENYNINEYNNIRANDDYSYQNYSSSSQNGNNSNNSSQPEIDFDELPF